MHRSKEQCIFMAKQSNIDAVVPKAPSRKKVVATENRSARVYKRAGFPSVPFCEKEEQWRG